MASNRVVVGLPARYEKAKREIAKFEKRESLIREALDHANNGDELHEWVTHIIEGHRDD